MTAFQAMPSQAIRLDRVVAAFLDDVARAHAAPNDATDLDVARASLEDLQRIPLDQPAAAIEDVRLSVGPTGAVAIRFLRPAMRNGRPLPFIFYLHGGGWVMGTLQTHDRLMRELAAGAEAVVVAVDYALAPEATYPVQIEQAYAALCHLVDHAPEFGLDASRISVAGDCAGGTMAAALAILAKQRRGPPLVLQLLFCPIMAEPDAGACAGTPWLTSSVVCRYIEAAFPDVGSRRQPTALPLHASLETLNDLPPALVVVADADPLCAQGEAYARRLIEAGVSASATRQLGTIHDFTVLNALAATPATRGAIAQAIAALRLALYGPPP